MEAFLSAPIQAILGDNGTAFDGEFARAAGNKDITRFYTHPNCPQQNAVNERFNWTLREGFLETHENLTDDLQQMNEAPADWLTGYNGFCPHRSLKYATPISFSYNSLNGRLGCDHTSVLLYRRIVIYYDIAMEYSFP